jgi:hypothetical protein
MYGDRIAEAGALPGNHFHRVQECRDQRCTGSGVERVAETDQQRPGRSGGEPFDIQAADVVRVASLGTTEQGESDSQFRVDYLKPSGAIGFYPPD